MNQSVKLNDLIKSGDTGSAKKLLAKLAVSKQTRLAIMGVIAVREEDTQAAVSYFERALQLDRVEPIAIAGYARHLLKEKKRVQAYELTKRGIEAHPSNLQILEAHVSALTEMDKVSEAIVALRPLIEGDGASPAQILTFASLLRADLQPQLALDTLRAHEAKLHAHPAYQKAIADCLAEISPADASRQFELLGDRATKSTKWNRSFTELRLGNFELGWSLYEFGLTDEVGRVGRPLPAQVKGLPVVTELDSLNENLWTVFSTEQGIGDQILFLSALPQALARFPKSMLVCEQRLVPVYRRAAPTIQVYPYAMVHNFEGQSQRFNGIFPIGSLMRHFRSNREDFLSTSFPYLSSNANIRQTLHDRIREKFPSEVLVGVSWVGGYWDRQQKTKSIEFKQFFDLLGYIPGVRFISLQYGDVKEAKAYANENRLPITFLEGVDFKKDMERWTALIDLCAYHISVSTALVHFAGALGKRVELLLNDKQAPFIWELGEGRSLPYPTVTIHRRRPTEDLPEFAKRIQRGLQP